MRNASIDLLRMIAIFVMVFVHFGENLSGYTFKFAGFGAPLFAFLSGVSYYLWVSGQEKRGKTDAEITAVSLRRGIFVIAVGFAFNILIWMPQDVFNWDVLTFIGFGLLVLNGMRNLPLPIPVFIALAIILVSPVFRELVDYSSYWQNRYYDPDMTLTDITFGFLITGYFPLFPWLAYPLLGYTTGSILFQQDIEPEEKQLHIRSVIIMGIVLISLSSLLLYLNPYLPSLISNKYLGGWTMFPPTIEYVLGTMGITLMMLGLSHKYLDSSPQNVHSYELLKTAKLFSQYSFTIYVLHHIVHIWPLWVYALLQGQETTYYWMNAMPITLSMPLAAVFLITTFFLLKNLGEERNYGIESLMRKVCDK